jgi:hypothetical protein
MKLERITANKIANVLMRCSFTTAMRGPGVRE